MLNEVMNITKFQHRSRLCFSYHYLTTHLYNHVIHKTGTDIFLSIATMSYTYVIAITVVLIIKIWLLLLLLLLF